MISEKEMDSNMEGLMRMRKYLAVLALLAASAAPALAANDDPASQSLVLAVQDMQKADLNMRNAAIVALQGKAAMQQMIDAQQARITDLETRCGAPCQDAAPQANAAEPPTAAAKPAPDKPPGK